MSRLTELREKFDLVHDVAQFKAYADEQPDWSSRNRYEEWRAYAGEAGLFEPEFLLPRILRDCPTGLPKFMTDSPGNDRYTDDELRLRIDELGPWTQYFQVRPGVETSNNEVQRDRVSFRSHLLSGTVEMILGERIRSTSILDMACNSGFFALDMRFRGAGSVTGIDLRKRHVKQAMFLNEAYGIDPIKWMRSDVYDFEPDRTWDVVFNFGLMYHLTQPLEVVEKTYRLCNEFAVFDSMVHLEPFAGFIASGGHNIKRGTMGNHPMQIEPTYRGLIELLYEVGFSELVEVVGRSELDIPFYDQFTRRVIIAFK